MIMTYWIDGVLHKVQRPCDVELATNERGINGKRQYPDKERDEDECVAMPRWSSMSLQRDAVMLDHILDDGSGRKHDLERSK